MKILVVDDSTLVTSKTRLILESAGHEVVCRTLGMGTGAAAMREKPDVVLVDVNMPGIDGGSIVKILHDEVPAEGRPVMLLHSDMDEAELAELASRVNADGYVKKTSSGTTLLTELAKWSCRVTKDKNRMGKAT